MHTPESIRCSSGPKEVDADEFERDTLGDARKCASEALEIKDAIAGAEKKIQLLGDEIASCEPFAHSEFELPDSVTARTATVCGTTSALDRR